MRKASVDWQSLSNDWENIYKDSKERWRDAFVPLFKGTIYDQGKAWNQEYGYRFNVVNLYASAWFDDYPLTFAQEINDTTKSNLSDMLQQAQFEGWSIPQMQERTDMLFRQWMKGDVTSDEMSWYKNRLPPHRTELIARTETMRSSNAGSFELFKEWGSQKKNWQATGDDRTRKSHMDAWGKYGDIKNAIPMDELFVVGATQLRYPGDPMGDTNETLNCRCCVLPVVDRSAPARQPPGDFKRYGDAQAWMKANYPNIDFQMAGMPLVHVNEIIKTFDEHAQKYPQAADTMRYLSFRKGSDYGVSKTGIAFAHSGRNERGIYFNSESSEWKRKTLQNVKAPKLGGWLIGDTNETRETLTHEFGHILDYYMRGENGSLMKVVGNDGMGQVSGTWSMWKNRNNLLKAKDADLLSRYGVTNINENIAEAFVAINFLPRAQWSDYITRFDTALNILAGNPAGIVASGQWKLLRTMADGPAKDAALAEIQALRRQLGFIG